MCQILCQARDKLDSPLFGNSQSRLEEDRKNSDNAYHQFYCETYVKGSKGTQGSSVLESRSAEIDRKPKLTVVYVR